MCEIIRFTGTMLLCCADAFLSMTTYWNNLYFFIHILLASRYNLFSKYSFVTLIIFRILISELIFELQCFMFENPIIYLG